jgi:lantibiotic modifying enzyme
MQIHDTCNALNISSNVFLEVEKDTLLSASALSKWTQNSKSVDVFTDDTDQSVFPQSPNLLQSAKEIAHWIESEQLQNAQRSHWVSEPDHTRKSIAISAPNSTIRQISETILFFLQLAKATGDAQYLKTAAKGADYLIAAWNELVDRQVEVLLSGRGANLSVNGGLAGAAYILNETTKATGNEKFRGVARAVTDYIVQAAKSVGSGSAWSDAPGIAGDGSIVLYLLYAAREFKSSLYGLTAERAGDHILELATHEYHGGFSWRGFPPFPGLPKDAYLPGFEDGTASITYVFARLYSETNKAKYLFAARQGAMYLQSVAPPDSNAAFISHPLSDLPKSQYSGFCQGPAGTARAYIELHKITREPVYQILAERMAQAILQWRFQNNLPPGHRISVCQCCNLVAVIDFFIQMWVSTGRLTYLASAQRTVHQLVRRNVCAESDDNGVAASVGLALLHMHLAEQGRYSAIIRLDNPCANKWPA